MIWLGFQNLSALFAVLILLIISFSFLGWYTLRLKAHHKEEELANWKHNLAAALVAMFATLAFGFIIYYSQKAFDDRQRKKDLLSMLSLECKMTIYYLENISPFWVNTSEGKTFEVRAGILNSQIIEQALLSNLFHEEEQKKLHRILTNEKIFEMIVRNIGTVTIVAITPAQNIQNEIQALNDNRSLIINQMKDLQKTFNFDTNYNPTVTF
jgi:hypothetical protein